MSSQQPQTQSVTPAPPAAPLPVTNTLTDYRLRLVETNQLRTEGKIDVVVAEVAGLRSDLRVLRVKVALVSAAIGALAGKAFGWLSETVKNL